MRPLGFLSITRRATTPPIAWIGARPFWQIGFTWAFLVIGLSVWFLNENRESGGRWHIDDPMAFSGFAAVIIGLIYSVAVDRDQRVLLNQWHIAGTIDLRGDEKRALDHTLVLTSVAFQLVVGTTVLLAMYIGYNWIVSIEFNSDFFIASMTCALLVGMRLGRLASHGMIGLYLRTYRVPFWLTVGHPDSAGGLGRIGRFFLVQSFAVMALIIWLTSWIFLMTVGGYEVYGVWIDHFVNLLIIAVAVFSVAFLLPVYCIKSHVHEWKRCNAYPKLERIREELRRLRDAGHESAEIERQERELVAKLEEIITLPNWPIAPRTRNVFITGVVIPLLINLAATAMTS